MKIQQLKRLSTFLASIFILNKKSSLLAIGMAVIVAGLATWQITQIEKHYSLNQFQPKNHPQILKDNSVKEKFLIEDTNAYMVSFSLKKTGVLWTQQENINLLEAFVEKFQENDKVFDVISLSNIETAISDSESFRIGSVAELASEISILDNPLLSPHVISKDGRHAAVIVRPETLTSDEQEKLLSTIQSSIEKYKGDIDVQIGGPAAVTTQMTQLLSKEILLFTLLSLSLSILILSLMFKGFTAPLTCLFVVMVANLAGLGLMSFLEIPLTVLSNTVPILMTITVVAITSHTLIRMSEIIGEQGVSKKDAIVLTFKELCGPHILTAVTTAIGFATLITSDVPIISDYGKSVASGVLIACGMTLLLLPCCLLWLKAPRRRQWSFSSAPIIDGILVHKKIIFSSLLVLTLSLGVIGQNLNWSALLFDDLPVENEARKASLFADEHLGGTIPLHITLDSELEKQWHQPEALAKLETLTEKFRQSGQAGSVMSLSDFIKAARPDQSIPKMQKTVAEIYFVYGMSEDNPVDAFLTPNGKSTRISLRMQDLPSKQILATIDKFTEQAEATFPGMGVTISGPALTIHTINRELASQLIFGFFTALIWIVLVLSLVYRSLAWALVSVIPNLLPPLILLGVLAITQTPIKPGIALIFAISLGIAFDNTVYMLSRLKKLLRGRSMENLPIRQLLQDEFLPCCISSLSLMAGFSIFIFSYFSINKLFGIFMMLSIGAGLLGDLVFLPVLLSLFPGLLSFRLHNVIIMNTARVGSMVSGSKKIVSTSLVLAALVFFGFKQAQAAKMVSAQSILNKIQKNNNVPYEKAEIKMLIKERDGSVKERHLIIKKMNLKESKVLVKLDKPADLKGVGLLSIKNGKTETQWLYLPSEKRSRRIVSSNKNGRFLDSDLSYEDLSITTYQNFTNSIEKEYKKNGKKITVILSLVKDKDATSYGKIKTWVDSEKNRILKAAYFNHKGKRVKEMLFSNYKKYGNVWRARKITVSNKKKRRSTILELEKVSLKKISSGEFSMSALEEG